MFKRIGVLAVLLAAVGMGVAFDGFLGDGDALMSEADARGGGGRGGAGRGGGGRGSGRAAGRFRRATQGMRFGRNGARPPRSAQDWEALREQEDRQKQIQERRERMIDADRVRTQEAYLSDMRLAAGAAAADAAIDD